MDIKPARAMARREPEAPVAYETSLALLSADMALQTKQCPYRTIACFDNAPSVGAPRGMTPSAGDMGAPGDDGCATLVLVNRRQRRLVNIRFWADRAIEAMRVEVSRLEGGSESHCVDLDFYLIAAWRLMEQIRQAWVGYQVPGAEELWREFNTRFPYIDETRDWWIHATDRIVNHTYFANAIMRWTQPPTFVICTSDLPDLERMYERFCELLGPLPEREEPAGPTD